MAKTPTDLCLKISDFTQTVFHAHIYVIQIIFRTVFSVGNASGKLLHFDAKTREFLEELNLCQGQIQVVKYSPKGTYLGIGTSNGSIFYWPALEGDRNEPLMCSNKAIKQLKFDDNESILAFIGQVCHQLGIFGSNFYLILGHS